jgi:hypothetical protein
MKRKPRGAQSARKVEALGALDAKAKSPGNSLAAKGQAAEVVAAQVDVPLARAALGLVGVDPDAEAVWASTINDPQTPPEVRKD